MTPLRTIVLTAALASSLTASAATATRQLNVALAGDSLAYGAGDEDGKGIAGRLEPELLSRGFKTVVTKNLGTTGATTRDVTALLQEKAARKALARADVIVLSVGANDLRVAFLGQEPVSPLVVADRVLESIDGIVAELRLINADARILILGAYAPVRHERVNRLLEPLIMMWDAALTAQFDDDPFVEIVPMSDIVDRPARLSRIDSFHPGGEAYQVLAKRIAEMIDSGQ